MYVIRHQTISIYNQVRRHRPTIFIFGKRFTLHQIKELKIIFVILENVLAVYTAQHHMINTRLAGFSW